MRTRFFLPALLLSLAIAGCSLFGPPTTALRELQVVAETASNQDAATALDIVFVYDATSASLLPKSGPDWFQNKAALTANLASNLDVVSLQIPPTTVVDVDLPQRSRKAIAVYSYANYIAVAGQPMGNLTPFRKMTIRLAPDAVIYAGS